VLVNLVDPIADVLGMADFYQILGISQQASESEIRSAFRRLARQYHPDRNPGDSTAEAKFVEVNEAHATLADPQKRRKYDVLQRLQGSQTGRPAQPPVQDFDERLFHQGSRVFQMGNYADILSNLGEPQGAS
jgi:DnaJ-class molecular chaperone